MPTRVLMMVGDFVETLEVYAPYMALQCLGFTVEICCPNKNKGETVTTAIHNFNPMFQTYEEKLGYNIPCTINFPDVNPRDFDAMWIPGGRSPEYLRTNPKVCEMVKFMMDQNRPVAASCHGPQLLVPTGAISGRKMTCYPSCEVEVTLAGANFTKCPPTECVVDGNLITGPTFMSTPKMVHAFAEMLGCKIVPPTH